MKIAYIYDVIYPYVKGGAEKRFWELAKRLSSRGHEVHIFGMKSWKGNSYMIKDNVHIHGVCRPMELYLRTGIRSTKQVLYFSFYILPSLWKYRFDIIDCNAFPYIPFFPVKLYSLLKRIPLITTWQEVWDTYWYRYLGYFRGAIARLIEKIVIRLSDNIIAYTLKVKEELIRHGANRECVRMIPNGIDLKIVEEITPDLEESDLIFAGRLIKDKNVDILIKSVSLVKKELDDIRCLIIGEGPEKEKLIELVNKLNLNDTVIFKGFLAYEKVISYMKSSKIFVFPSSREGFGIAAIEAMACGLPVITVSHPMNAAAELIKDGENGFICNLSEKDICHKILQLLGDKILRGNLGRQAYHSTKDYDWDRIAEKAEAFYNYKI